MRKTLFCLLFPFLLSNLHAEEEKEEKKEPKKHKFVVEEVLSFTENTSQNLIKAKYNYKIEGLEQLVEISFDYIKASEEIKRKLLRAHYNIKGGKRLYWFGDLDYQGDKVNHKTTYITAGGGTKIGFTKVDLGYGYKIVDKATIVNVLSSSIEANKEWGKINIGGKLRLNQPLKVHPRRLSSYMEVVAKYKLSEHFSSVISYIRISEKPKKEGDSWKKYTLRAGFGLDY